MRVGETFDLGFFVERFYSSEQLVELLGVRPVKLWKCLGLRRSFSTVSIVVVCLYPLNYAKGLLEVIQGQVKVVVLDRSAPEEAMPP